jgi:membrane-associated protease RseP (regulator of RpoE activity)
VNFINTISGWLFLLLGLAVSIALHEIGHLWPAKKFGVKVTKYMVGFGPTLFSKKRGDTEYGIKAIPLGGYIQMIGMVPPSSVLGTKKNIWQRLTSSTQPQERVEIDPADQGKTFYELAPWRKLIIMFGGPFANLLIALVLSVVLFSGFGAYERTTTLQNVVACVPSDANPKCDAIGTESPALKAGLKAGDKILSFDGNLVARWADVDLLLQRSVGKTVEIRVLRAGEEKLLFVEPVLMTLAGTTKPYLGVYLEAERFQQSPISAVNQLGSMMIETGSMIVQLPLQAANAFSELAPGSARNQEGAISIIGLGQYSGQIAANQSISIKDKLISQLGILMSLNVALFVFNMVPLVPLDGGHIAGAVYEWFKRGIWALRGKKLKRPVDTGQMMPIAYFVAVLLIALTVVLVLRDILNPLSL